MFGMRVDGTLPLNVNSSIMLVILLSLPLSLSSLLSVGTSEKALEAAFTNARRDAHNPLCPAILFIDEFQSLFTKRGGGGSGSGLASQLLALMDSEPRVPVVAATNVPEAVDPAFLRTGRFDRAVHCPPPTEEHRVRVLTVHLAKLGFASTPGRGGGFSQGPNDGPLVGPAAELAADLATQTKGFTVADLGHLTRCALYRAADRKADQEADRRAAEPLVYAAASSNAPKAMTASGAETAATAETAEAETGTCGTSSMGGEEAGNGGGRGVALEVGAVDYAAALLEVKPSVPPDVARRYERWKLPSH